MLILTNLSVVCSWWSLLLAALLVFQCVTIATAFSSACVPALLSGTAVTNSATTLLTDYGVLGNVITTLDLGTTLDICCRVSDVSIYDDPWWLYVFVPELGMAGWVADYYADCGYIGYCIVPDC